MKIIPIGSRCFVEEINPVDDITGRAARAGIYAVVMEENKPKPTEGVVVAVGTDPFIRELVNVGDHVFFSPSAGMYQFVEGKKYRVLTVNEITSVGKVDPTEDPLK